MRDYRINESPWVHIETFGFKHGIPETVIGALLVDLRGVSFADPDLQEHLTGRDGTDPDVIEHVMASPGAFASMNRTVGQAKALLDFNSASNFTLRILIGDDDGRTRAVVVGDAVAEILNARGIPAEVEHHHLTPQEDRPMTGTGTEDQTVTTRDAVRAFHRLLKATATVVAAPFHPGALESLSNAAREANVALAAAGLLGLPRHELVALVRQEFPDYDPTGGLGRQKDTD
ncbi:RNase adapter RapZ [Streptomyces sp. RLB3-6]|uniref:RapZ C-terminal domain-containing protein n=1 Tax=Streptomyces sp. RLB3-6 TaxID=2594457 RepID=UPI0013DEAFF7|nr:RNase adapter RapZ [Streptomyces sp. RLB3-6]